MCVCVCVCVCVCAPMYPVVSTLCQCQQPCVGSLLTHCPFGKGTRSEASSWNKVFPCTVTKVFADLGKMGSAFSEGPEIFQYKKNKKID